jgi:orotate phosphoribosyltransferase
VADRLHLPMQYVRKKAKGFGRGAQIEGSCFLASAYFWSRISPPTAKARSTSSTRCARPAATATIVSLSSSTTSIHRAKKSLAILALRCTHSRPGGDVLAVAKASGKFEPKMLSEVEKFIGDPAGWSKAHGGAAEAAE